MALFKHKEIDRELGFGTRVTEPDQRLMNKDGSSNVTRRGLNFFETLSFYHKFITMSWTKFFVVVIFSYLAVNLSFAALYYLIGIQNLNGMIANTDFDRFMEAFFFSTQTISTVGFGRLNPVGLADSSIAAIESMIGLMGFALVTGILYGRFSRPVAKILYSDNAIIAPYRGITAFMFRIGNKRKNELIEVEANVFISYTEKENEKDVRKFATFTLERDKISVLSMTWTIVHPIDENSPIYKWTENNFKEKNVEVLVMIKCYEETFAQTVHSRTSYKADELVVGAKFNPLVDAGPNGSVIVHLDKINDFERVNL